MLIFGDKINAASIDTSKNLIMNTSCHRLEATHTTWTENSNVTTGTEIAF